MAKVIQNRSEKESPEKLVTIFIDGRECQVPENLSLLEACRMEGYHIPTLCYMDGLTPWGGCRICVVEVEGQPNLVASCVTPIREGMKVLTASKKVREARRANLELILSNHPLDCQLCDRNQSCDLQSLCYEFGIREIRFQGERKTHPIDNSSPSVKRDLDRCILCGRCIRTCAEVQSVYAIDFADRGFNSYVSPSLGLPLGESVCINCGQCVLACPTGALSEVSHVEMVWEALDDPEKYVILQTAPAVRVSIGEPFGIPIGSISTGKMVAGFRRLGFDAVFDTNFAADLTILEEGTEFEYLKSRISQVEYLWQQLIDYGIPIQKPVGGHAVFVEALKFLPALPREQYVAQTLAIELYLEAGIRGVEIGTLLADRDTVTRQDRYPALELVRLAIPRRTYTNNHMDVVATALKSCFSGKTGSGSSLLM
mgnify:CR=1 FL=1